MLEKRNLDVPNWYNSNEESPTPADVSIENCTKIDINNEDLFIVIFRSVFSFFFFFIFNV